MRLFKQLAILFLFPISFVVNAQELLTEHETSFFDSDQNFESPTGPSPGEDPVDTAPINDYAPLLVLGGIAVYAFSRKKFQLK